MQPLQPPSLLCFAPPAILHFCSPYRVCCTDASPSLLDFFSTIGAYTVKLFTAMHCCSFLASRSLRPFLWTCGWCDDNAMSDDGFFGSFDRAIYLIVIQLRFVRILKAFCTRCLCLATQQKRDFER
jgi:hypothetical protein